MKYGLSEKKIENELWTELLESKIKEADSVEFNLLYENQAVSENITSLSKYLTKKHKGEDKIYSGRITYRYELSEEVIKFIFSKNHKNWLNYELEDIALLQGEIEILATITHEQYIFLLMDEGEKKYWNSRGFEFGELL